MEQKITLSVVTVTFKPNIDELKLFINSFYKYNDLNEEAKLIIVDNSPLNFWDYSPIIKEFPLITIIPNPSNPGFGASNNIGFEKFNSEYVLFINNDVEFLEPVFTNIISVFKKDEKIGCIGIHQKGGAPSYFKKFDAPSNISNDTFIDKYHFISGAFMFFRSSVFKFCGRFDDKIFMYLEEYDISTRLIKNGYFTMYLPEYSFLHKIGNRKTADENLWEIGTKSYCYVCKKFNINPKQFSSNKRLILLFIYYLCKLNFKESIKMLRIIKKRNQIIKNSVY